jgi:hypothetical protein
MKTTKLYGASDDLIEVEGDCENADEFSGGDKAKYIGFSNGTVASIKYDERGVWAITVHAEGTGKIKKLFGLPDESDETTSQHHKDKHAPSYSDVLIIETEGKITITHKGSTPPKPPHNGLPKARAIIEYLESLSSYRARFGNFWDDVDEDDRNKITEGIAKICEGEKP